MINSKTIFQGYRRENGRVCIRNHVLIPVDDLSTRLPRRRHTNARWRYRSLTAGCIGPDLICTSAVIVADRT